VAPFTCVTRTSAGVCARQVFLGEKLKVEEGSFLEECLEHGNKYESKALQLLAEYPGLTGEKYRCDFSNYQTAFISNFVTDHKKVPRFSVQATPDGIWTWKVPVQAASGVLTRPSYEYVSLPVEVKCPHPNFDTMGLCKLEWWIQLQVQLLVLNAPKGFMGVYNHPSRFTVYEITRDDDVDQFLLETIHSAYEKALQMMYNPDVFRAPAGTKDKNIKLLTQWYVKTTRTVEMDGTRSQQNP